MDLETTYCETMTEEDPLGMEAFGNNTDDFGMFVSPDFSLKLLFEDFITNPSSLELEVNEEDETRPQADLLTNNSSLVLEVDKWDQTSQQDDLLTNNSSLELEIIDDVQTSHQGDIQRSNPTLELKTNEEQTSQQVKLAGSFVASRYLRWQESQGQFDVKRQKIVNVDLEESFSGYVGLALVYSSGAFLGKEISGVENVAIDGKKEELKKFPLRAWNGTLGHDESRYVAGLNLETYGVVKAVIVPLANERRLNLLFTTVSLNKSQDSRAWELLIFPVDDDLQRGQIGEQLIFKIPIQVVAELRNGGKLKRKKRLDTKVSHPQMRDIDIPFPSSLTREEVKDVFLYFDLLRPDERESMLKKMRSSMPTGKHN